MNVQYDAVDKAIFVLRNGSEGKVLVELRH